MGLVSRNEASVKRCHGRTFRATASSTITALGRL
jgi:hypothetical protein